MHLLQLNPVELATQLMVEDFTAFRRIEASEYVDDLFERSSNGGKEVGCCCCLLLWLLLLLLLLVVMVVVGGGCWCWKQFKNQICKKNLY